MIDEQELEAFIKGIINATREEISGPDSSFWMDEDMGGTWAWIGFAGRTRDSDSLDISNHEYVADALTKVYEPYVTIHRINHWACGWFEAIAIRVHTAKGKPSAVARKAFEFKKRLEQYPVLDEDDYLRREHEQELRYIESEVDRLVAGEDDYFPEELGEEAYAQIHRDISDIDQEISDALILEKLIERYARRLTCPICDHTVNVKAVPDYNRFTWDVKEIIQYGVDNFDDYREANQRVLDYRQRLTEVDPAVQPTLPGLPRTEPAKPHPVGTLIIHHDGRMICPNCFKGELK